MKISCLPSLSLLSILSSSTLPSITLAMDCGQWYSRDCLADDDVRYDKDYTTNILEQDDIWEHVQGFWIAESFIFDGNLQPVEPQHLDPDNPTAIPYIQFPHYTFTNITIQGSRMIEADLLIFPPAPAEFCDLPVPNGTFNVYPVGGECGVTGFNARLEAYFTSTQEKDGSLYTLPEQNSTTVEQARENRMLVINNQATFRSNLETNEFPPIPLLNTENLVFTNDQKTRASAVVDIYVVTPQASLLTRSFRTFRRKVSEPEWLDELNHAWNNNSVPEMIRFTPGATPCLLGDCPTEEAWCRLDPTCSSQVLYEEPDSSLNAGVITGIVLVGTAVLLLVMILLWRRSMAQQAKRYRTQFANRIAQSIDVRKSMKSLTPSVLANQFADIDETNRGRISKDDLWNFLNAHGGDIDDTIREHDFNALWAVLDTDNNGTVDFLEFCAFFTQCQDEYNEAVRRNPTNRASVRQSLATSMSVKFEEVSKAIASQEPASQAIEPVEEQGEETS